MVPEISNTELKARLGQPNPPLLLDVREPHELEIVKLDNVVAIPMGEIPARLGELDKGAETVVICRSGGRSGQITEFLVANGFTNVRNLVGGMNAWATQIDTSLPTY